MSPEWDSLPLLPLRCILEYLSLKNVLAATSTCRHWRQAMLLYEGRRNILKLKVKNLEQNLFLARLFRKHTEKLHIYMNCSEDQLIKFMTFVLPQFFDSARLEEVIFIGPIYVQQNPFAPFAKLNRIITESLIYKHAFLRKLAIMGCEWDSTNNDKDTFVHKQVECYSKPLSFTCVSSPADSILSQCNVDMMKLSKLRHIIFDYEKASTDAIETLSKLKHLSVLSLNVMYRRQVELPSIDWHRVIAEFNGLKLEVAVNIINLPHKRFKSVMDTVFVQGMPLVSLKVMFCRTIYTPLISHVSYMYSSTLRELVWVDAPHEGAETSRTIKSKAEEIFMLEMYNQVNPFILLCWQCINLRKLVIHGYWIWQYDLLGFARLRKSLQLEVSSLYANQGRFGARSLDGDCVLRVMLYDTPPSGDDDHIVEMNRYCELGWLPFPWRRLPPALRSHSSPETRTSYIVKEVSKPLGFMPPEDRCSGPEENTERQRFAYWALSLYAGSGLLDRTVKNAVDCPVEKNALLRKVFRRKIG